MFHLIDHNLEQKLCIIENQSMKYTGPLFAERTKISLTVHHLLVNKGMSIHWEGRFIPYDDIPELLIHLVQQKPYNL